MSVNVYGLVPSGAGGGGPRECFRASGWAWASLLAVTRMAAGKHGLDVDTDGWDVNEGAGLATQAGCDRLADAIERELTTRPPAAAVAAPSGASRTARSGEFAVTGWASSPAEIPFWEEYPDGFVPTGAPLAVREREAAQPGWADLVAEWVRFLRGCGGFEIW